MTCKDDRGETAAGIARKLGREREAKVLEPEALSRVRARRGQSGRRCRASYARDQ